MSRWTVLTLAVAIVLCSQLGHTGCLEDGTSSLKTVLDAIYEELGAPEMTDEVAEAIDAALFNRPYDKKPAMRRDVSVSWVDFDASIVATVSCMDGDDVISLRVRWRPHSELEELELDEVLTAD